MRKMEEMLVSRRESFKRWEQEIKEDEIFQVKVFCEFNALTQKSTIPNSIFEISEKYKQKTPIYYLNLNKTIGGCDKYKEITSRKSDDYFIKLENIISGCDKHSDFFKLSVAELDFLVVECQHIANGKICHYIANFSGI